MEAVNMDSAHIKNDVHERNVDNQNISAVVSISTSEFVVMTLDILPHPQVRICAPENSILLVIGPPAVREQQSPDLFVLELDFAGIDDGKGARKLQCPIICTAVLCVYPF